MTCTPGRPIVSLGDGRGLKWAVSEDKTSQIKFHFHLLWLLLTLLSSHLNREIRGFWDVDESNRPMYKYRRTREVLLKSNPRLSRVLAS